MARFRRVVRALGVSAYGAREVVYTRPGAIAELFLSTEAFAVYTGCPMVPGAGWPLNIHRY
jgi:hypothetical protein